MRLSTYGFFELNLVYPYSEKLVCEFAIVVERVCIINFFAARRLDEHSRFPTGQRLQSAPQVTVL